MNGLKNHLKAWSVSLNKLASEGRNLNGSLSTVVSAEEEGGGGGLSSTFIIILDIVLLRFLPSPANLFSDTDRKGKWA